MLTLRKTCGKLLSTDSSSSNPNVLVISVIPCSQYGLSPFTKQHRSCEWDEKILNNYFKNRNNNKTALKKKVLNYKCFISHWYLFK